MVYYRVMHRKRVTSELHDSYFRLMTIKHSISKIEWASNDYIIIVIIITRPMGPLGNPDVVWGPEKMLIRCNKESQHPAE